MPGVGVTPETVSIRAGVGTLTGCLGVGWGGTTSFLLRLLPIT